MVIAVASGKGGTGKTSISVSIAKSIEGQVNLFDCDVEEPNDILFLNPDKLEKQDVNIKVPVIDQSKCTVCGKCGEICEYNAIAVLNKSAMVFNELCHACGGCKIACTVDAISEEDYNIGEISNAQIGNINFFEGRLGVGKVMAPPVIRQIKESIEEDKINILDCPPGNACPMITAVTDSDYVILVTEPTPFGLNDLKISVDTVRQLNIPFGVVINRFDGKYQEILDYLENENIPLLLKVDESVKVAHAYSKGECIVDALPELKKDFNQMIADIKRSVL